MTQLNRALRILLVASLIVVFCVFDQQTAIAKQPAKPKHIALLQTVKQYDPRPIAAHVVEHGELASLTYHKPKKAKVHKVHALIHTPKHKPLYKHITIHKHKHKPVPVRTYVLPGSSQWRALAQCESSGNPKATNGSHWGLYQFDISTWLANGGGKYAPRADLATPAEQLAIAKILYNRRGWQPWTCARILGF